jgi:hypothetical protein
VSRETIVNTPTDVCTNCPVYSAHVDAIPERHSNFKLLQRDISCFRMNGNASVLSVDRFSLSKSEDSYDLINRKTVGGKPDNCPV